MQIFIKPPTMMHVRIYFLYFTVWIDFNQEGLTRKGVESKIDLENDNRYQ